MINTYKAGSAIDANVFWIHLKPREIAEKFEEQTQVKVSNTVIKRVLKSMNFKFRKMHKNVAIGSYENRNEQFDIINSLVLLMSLDSPVLSIDCKKKERLGNLYREGKCYTTSPIKVYDHDYHYLSQGAVIPHGIYDMHNNVGYMSIGKYHETASFVTDNLLWWWETYGIDQYPNAKSILILCDAGGANSYRHHAFKKQILALSKEIGVDIIICHYPPYSSKWNPIEHRLFAHVHHAIQGVPFTDYDSIVKIIAKTKTKNGLKVIARLNPKEYKIGIKTDKTEIDFSRIQFHPKIPALSYRVCA